MTAFWLIFIATVVAQAPSTKPNIVFILADDLGWFNVGYHQTSPNPEVQTPNIDALVAEGIELTRHYVYSTCTPSRSSLQSGRLPIHVTQVLLDPDDPSCGIPRNMTGVAEKMQMGGWETHFVGKWDAGMATPDHTPQGRGYSTSLNYFSHKNDYWTQKELSTGCPMELDIKDLWLTDKPANKLNGTKYEEDLFIDQITNIIQQHNESVPLFLFYADHATHAPLQVFENQLDAFDFINNDESMCSIETPYIYPGFNGTIHCRRTYASLLNVLDENVGNITRQLKNKGIWNNTIIVFSADNGGPTMMSESGSNNYPLRGGKFTEFEGGIRSVAFVSGGYLPQNLRGTQQNGLISIADWYTTFCAIAEVDSFDERAAQWGLPSVDGLNMWPMLSGINSTSPRIELPITNNTFIFGDYKLIVGTAIASGWTSPVFPNSTSPINNPYDIDLDCGDGCLFNVVDDPTEHNNIANQNKTLLNFMQERQQYWLSTYYQNNEQGEDSCPTGIEGECACWMAMNYYGGFFGPYQYLPSPP